METELKELIEKGCKKAEEFIIQGYYQEAELIANQILKVDSNCYKAKLILGVSLGYQKKIDEAKEIISKAIEENPDNFRGYNNYGLICGDSTDAIKYFRRASELTDESTPAINLALEIDKIGESKEAEEILVKFSKVSSVAEFNLAGFLHRQNKYTEAEQIYRKINNPISKYNLAKICLLTGRFEEGFRLSESRWEAFPHLVNIKSQLKLPYWNGSSGKRIVLFCEEGCGDYVMFSRYVKKVIEISKEVYLDCNSTLREAFVGFKFYNGEAVDCCCSVISLPYLLNCYEIPEPIKIGSKEISFEKYKPCVGLCWCGSPSHPEDNSRSILLQKFEEISKITRCVGLGWAYGKKWEKNAEKVKIIDTIPIQKDLASLAGIIKEMELVITVDTCVAHVAGSLGKKTWLLLSYNGEWRWGLSEKTPWYPSIRIFRQKKRNDWDSVISEIKEQLCENENNYQSLLQIQTI